MIINGVPKQFILDCADWFQFKADITSRSSKSYSYRVRLTPGWEAKTKGKEKIPTKYQRISATGSRVHAICWHGYKDFLKSLFENYPEASVLTAMYTYRNRDQFLKFHEASKHTNIGSQVNPMEYQYACECHQLKEE